MNGRRPPTVRKVPGCAQGHEDLPQCPRNSATSAPITQSGMAVRRLRPSFNGQSGNPKGRPKGTRNAASHDALENKIKIEVKGSWRKMSVRKAAYRRRNSRAAEAWRADLFRGQHMAVLSPQPVELSRSMVGGA